MDVGLMGPSHVRGVPFWGCASSFTLIKLQGWTRHRNWRSQTSPSSINQDIGA
jgi:hypothetical protein